MLPAVNSPTPEKSPLYLARILAAASTTFLLIFLLAVLAALLPLRIGDPAWQLGLTGSLVNNGGFALISLVLVHLAAYLDPSNGRWQARSAGFRHLAIAATLGFLLIIPLQGFATWKALAAAQSQRSIQLGQVGQRFDALRQAIRKAPTIEALKGNLQELRGPALQPADLAQPLPQLRSQLLGAIDQAQSSMEAQIPAIAPERGWGLIKESVRIALSALAFAFSFGVASRRPGATHSLLEELGRGWKQSLKARRITAKDRRVAQESADNSARLLARQEQRRKAWKLDYDRKRKEEAKRRQRGR